MYSIALAILPQRPLTKTLGFAMTSISVCRLCRVSTVATKGYISSV